MGVRSKPNNLKDFGSMKTKLKGLNRIAKIFSGLLCLREKYFSVLPQAYVTLVDFFYPVFMLPN
jgi:hypothetical protein